MKTSKTQVIKALFSLMVVAAGIVLSGCSVYNVSVQPRAPLEFLLTSEQTLGQTFTSTYAGLEGVELLLVPREPGDGSLLLHVRQDLASKEDIALTRLPLSDIQQEDFYSITFAGIKDSSQTDYYILLEIEGQGVLAVGAAEADSYIQGSLYQNGLPQEAQLAFRLMYDSQLRTTGLFKELFIWAGLLVVSIYAYIVPGWALLSLVWGKWKNLRWPEKIGLAGGVSLAIYPLLFLWTDVVFLHLGAFYAWLPGGVGLVFLIWRAVQRWQLGIKPRFKPVHLSAADVALLLILVLIILTRFWSVRTLDMPMGGDSVHHTMITQLFLDHNGLFTSWQPYAEINHFSYHFGFHSLAAVFSWLTHLPAPQAVLFTGQILNILAVLSLVPLARRLSNNDWVVPVVVLIAGLLVKMPMVYVNWGRYTQLAGLVILPVAFYIVLSMLEESSSSVSIVAMSILTAAGLFLMHYRVAVFLLLFLLSYLVFGAGWKTLRKTWKNYVALILGWGIFTLPWLLRITRGEIFETFLYRISTPPARVTQALHAYNEMGALTDYLPVIIWLAVLLAAGWALWRNDGGIRTILGWMLLVLLAANPDWLGLPGLGILDNFTVMISAYLPAALIIGSAVAWLIERALPLGHWSADIQRAVLLNFVAVLFAVGVWGARQRLADVDISTNSLVTRPDLRAASWMAANLPEDVFLLINNTSTLESTRRGSDAGWWLPMTARRQVVLPPLLSLYEEGESSYADLNRLMEYIDEYGLSDPVLLEKLQKNHITHVYIGQQQGKVNSHEQALTAEALLRSPNFLPIYHQDRTWVFEVAYLK